MKKNENTQKERITIQVKQSGPYIVSGTVLIADKDGTETVKEGKTALCRCSASVNKPFYNGSHKDIEFDK